MRIYGSRYSAYEAFRIILRYNKYVQLQSLTPITHTHRHTQTITTLMNKRSLWWYGDPTLGTVPGHVLTYCRRPRPGLPVSQLRLHQTCNLPPDECAGCHLPYNFFLRNIGERVILYGSDTVLYLTNYNPYLPQPTTRTVPPSLISSTDCTALVLAAIRCVWIIPYYRTV